MGDVIYLPRRDDARSSEADGFVLTYVPICPDQAAGERPLHECGLPRFGQPLVDAHDWVSASENYQLAQYRVRTSKLLSGS